MWWQISFLVYKVLIYWDILETVHIFAAPKLVHSIFETVQGLCSNNIIWQTVPVRYNPLRKALEPKTGFTSWFDQFITMTSSSWFSKGKNLSQGISSSPFMILKHWIMSPLLRLWPQSSIHGLFGTGGLECTVCLVCSCISANVTKLNCTLERQGVDWRIKDLEGRSGISSLKRPVASM